MVAFSKHLDEIPPNISARYKEWVNSENCNLNTTQRTTDVERVHERFRQAEQELFFSAGKPTANMRILRIDEALKECEVHLSLEKAVEAEVQSLLAQSLLILIYAEFEKKVRELIRERCQYAADDSVREFLDSCAESVFRSLKINELRTGLLPRCVVSECR